MISVALIILFLGKVISEKSDGFISVNPETNMFIDGYGRERFFHGTNVVVKHFPFHPETTGYSKDTFSEDDMKILQKFGLNSIRLGMMLPGYVPKRGEYNETYIKVIQSIVTTAAKYGIYTLLDMHQDVFSPKFCVEGMPDWIVNTHGAKDFPIPLHKPFNLDPKTGYPYSEDCAKFSWADYYFTEAAGQAFQNLYDNVDGLRDEWAHFWKKTADVFKKESSVIGYELINEPFCGNVFKHPTLLIPGVADYLNLQPTYDALQKAIRQVDDQHNIFFEGVTWDFFEVGFTEVPGGKQYQNRSVLSYHYYEPPDFSKKLNFEARLLDLKRLKCGGFLTEMFTVGTDFNSMFEMFDLCDKFKQSWHGWMYKSYGCVEQNLGCLNMSSPGKESIQVANTSRTYPQAVAGHTHSYTFDIKTKVFILVYETVGSCKSGRTIVYFNKNLHYPNGYRYEIYPNFKVTLSENEYFLYLDEVNKVPNTVVTFKLFPLSFTESEEILPVTAMGEKHLSETHNDNEKK